MGDIFVAVGSSVLAGLVLYLIKLVLELDKKVALLIHRVEKLEEELNHVSKR